MINRIIFFSVAVSLMGCSGEKAADLPKAYFDLAAFADSSFLSLDTVNVRLEKTVEFNGQTETMLTPASFLREDMEIVKQMDINKPSWKTSFTASTKQTEAGEQTTYLAIDEKLPVRQMRITRYSGTDRVRQIYAFRKSKNLLYGIEQEIHWHCDSVLEINTVQNITLLKPKRYHSIIRFIAK